MRSSRRVVAMAAGGTAGHVTIAIAIAEAFARAAPEVEVIFLGARHGTEATLVPARGFRLELLPAAPWKRERLAGRLSSLRQAASAVPAARRVLAEHAVGLVIGTGGYASFGALVAARGLRLATALHEANAMPGLANRLLSRVVERSYLSCETARSSFPAGRCQITGTPLRGEILELAAHGKTAPATGRTARVLVTAGSEGSPFLDREAPRLLGRVARGVELEVRHQAGANDARAVVAAYEEHHVSATVACFIEDIASAYEWADLAIACCGASTVAEIAAVGLPSLLVPLAGASDDHQGRNAEIYASAGRAWIVREEDWRADDLHGPVAEILRNPAAWETASRALRPVARHDAAGVLVADCLEWMTGRW